MRKRYSFLLSPFSSYCLPLTSNIYCTYAICFHSNVSKRQLVPAPFCTTRDGYRFTIVQATANRIDLVRITRLPSKA